jgi:hypothetical protein
VVTEARIARFTAVLVGLKHVRQHVQKESSMKKLVIVAFVIGAFLVGSFALAQVYDKGGGIFEMAGKVTKYEAYDAKKPDGKIGRLYVVPHGKEAKAGDTEEKKFYITDQTKLMKGTAVATPVNDLKAETVVKVRYKKTVATKDKPEELIAKEIDIL